jgi:hypothetical protein
MPFTHIELFLLRLIVVPVAHQAQSQAPAPRDRLPEVAARTVRHAGLLARLRNPLVPGASHSTSIERKQVARHDCLDDSTLDAMAGECFMKIRLLSPITNWASGDVLDVPDETGNLRIFAKLAELAGTEDVATRHLSPLELQDLQAGLRRS